MYVSENADSIVPNFGYGSTGKRKLVGEPLTDIAHEGDHNKIRF